MDFKIIWGQIYKKSRASTNKYVADTTSKAVSTLETNEKKLFTRNAQTKKCRRKHTSKQKNLQKSFS